MPVCSVSQFLHKILRKHKISAKTWTLAQVYVIRYKLYGRTYGEASLRDEVVGRLKHITSMHVVVVGITICSVASFNVI